MKEEKRQVNITYDKMEYLIKKIGSQMSVSPELLIDKGNIKIKEFKDELYEGLIVQCMVKIYGKQCWDITYPIDWWESFKERWFPKWLLKKYPVKYKKWNLLSLIPQYEIRGHRQQWVSWSSFGKAEDL